MACTALAGLTFYRADLGDPATRDSGEQELTRIAQLTFEKGNGVFPRCQHLAPEPRGQRIYVASHSDQIQPTPFLSVIDASDPGRPREIASYARAEQVEGLTVHGRLLLVAAHGDGLLIFDRGRGGELNLIGRLGGLGNAWTVRARDQLAYVIDARGALVTVDLSNPRAPKRLARLPLPGAPRDLDLAEGRAYVALGLAGVAVIDLSNPKRPDLIESLVTPGSALSVAWAAAAKALYVADWSELRVYSGSNPRRLRQIGREALPLPGSDRGRTIAVSALGNIIVVGKWTEISAYMYRPGYMAPDLVIEPAERIWRQASKEGERGNAFAIRITNEGNSPLSLGRASVTNGWQTSTLPEQLEPGDEWKLSLQSTEATRAAPSVAAVPSTVVLSLTSNDPDQPLQSITVDTSDRDGLGLGDLVPNWNFVRADNGEPWPLRGEKPQLTLLVYFATYCPVCNLEFVDLERLRLDYEQQGLQVLGVATGGIGGAETKEHLAAFAAQTGIGFPIVWDSQTKDEFDWPPGVSPFPRQVLVGAAGRIRYLASEHRPRGIDRALREAGLENPAPGSTSPVDSSGRSR